ncbi:glutathione S-transferase [Neorhizobium sp. NPDC001467]|uniref:glutathione S-transferase n=1 Tax=Neorhizobium sp. NPDC001467 TaxID=3390595 RepID=UPI003D068FD1
MKILYSPASPYSAKCRMAARYLGLDVENVKTDTNAAPADLLDSNPLGKIPVLIRDDGRGIYDSVAIMSYLDRVSGGRLYPKKHEKRTDAEVLEALCDGITDCLLAIVYERRFRPEDKIHQPWIDKQWEKVTRGLDHLEKNLPKTGKKLNGGHFSLAALLGYLDLRFAGQWEEERPFLAAWRETFAKRFGAYDEMKSNA